MIKLASGICYLNKRSAITSFEAERNRYYYRGDVEMYNYSIQKHLYQSLTRAFLDDFCKRDKKTYKNAQSRVEGQKIILEIIDLMRDPQIEMDAWIEDREFAYRRLAAGCFGAGYIEQGYAAMEKSINLCLEYTRLSVGTVLKYNSSVLDILTLTVEKDDGINLVEDAYETYTCVSGWEWFNVVRNDSRYLLLIERLKKYIDGVRVKK